MKMKTVYTVKTYPDGQNASVVGIMEKMSAELLKALIGMNHDEYAHFEMLCDGFNENRLALDDIHLVVEDESGEETLYHFDECEFASL